MSAFGNSLIRSLSDYVGASSVMQTKWKGRVCNPWSYAQVY